jgi:putative ABC transport system permease protein
MIRLPTLPISPWLRFAALNTLRNRRRSLVTLAIAALGTAAILLAGGFALYTYQGLAEGSARTTGHLVLANSAQFTQDEDTPLQHGLEGWTAVREQLQQNPSVRQVLPRVEFSGLIGNGDKSVVMVGVGIDPDAEFAVKGPFLTVTAGTLLDGRSRDTVMLGERLARNLKASPGSGLTLLATTAAGALNARDVTVVGLISTGVPEVDARLVYTDVLSAQQLLGSERVSSLGIFLDRMEATEPTRQRLSQQLLTPSPQLAMQTWLEQAPFYRSVKDLYNRIFGALGLIIGVIVVFVVTNAMAMAIIERTREIGTLRALGTLPGQLLRSLALEGLLLGGAGALVGAALSLTISIGLLIVPVEMPPPPGRSVGYPLQIAIDPTLYLLTLLVMTTLSTLAAAWVARRTVHRPITEALAHT